MIECGRFQPPEALAHLPHTHPYTHRPLLHYMLSIPPKIVCGPGEPRRLMRRALEELWPRGFHGRRSKDSFGGVFLRSLRPLADVLLKEDPRNFEVVRRGWVDAASFTNRLQRLTRSLPCGEPQLRQIVLLEFWIRDRRCDRSRGCAADNRGILPGTNLPKHLRRELDAGVPPQYGGCPE